MDISLPQVLCMQQARVKGKVPEACLKDEGRDGLCSLPFRGSSVHKTSAVVLTNDGTVLKKLLPRGHFQKEELLTDSTLEELR